MNQDLAETQIECAQKALSFVSAFDWQGLSDVLVEEAVMELPYAPDGVPQRIEGRAQIVDLMRTQDKAFSAFQIVTHEIYPCPSDDVVIVEATSFGLRTAGDVYQNRYVFVFQFDRDRICLWREFFNPHTIP